MRSFHSKLTLAHTFVLLHTANARNDECVRAYPEPVLAAQQSDQGLHVRKRHIVLGKELEQLDQLPCKKYPLCRAGLA